MRPLAVDLRSPALVVGRDVGHVARQGHELFTPIVRLADDALPGLRDVVLEAYDVFESEGAAELRRHLDGLVVYGVAPVEAAQGGGPVVAREEVGGAQGPEGGGGG